jgi:hypothetical protein
VKKKLGLGCLGVVIVGIALVVLLYIRFVSKGMAAHEARIGQKLSTVRAALSTGARPDAKLVARLAADPDVRNTLYEELKKHGMEGLFPASLRTFEAYAESDLVYWLCHPNELQQPPDEIEWMKTVTVNTTTSLGQVDYYLLRFRVKEPHWAAKHGWMAGVSGPYVKGRPLDQQIPHATFSELEPYGAKSPEEHVNYYHNLAVKRGLYTDIEAQLK